MTRQKAIVAVSRGFRFLYVALAALVLSIAMPLHAETVNINKADAATLQHYLTGVGAVKAEAIVAYRNKHGRFKSVDDLQKVKGIGEAIIRKNRDNLSVSKGVSRLSRKAKATNKSRPRSNATGKG